MSSSAQHVITSQSTARLCTFRSKLKFKTFFNFRSNLIFTFSDTFFSSFALGKPSRVIHIRNIPNEASDTEVISLGSQFGRVTNVLVLKGKNQAFLEMADEISATAMVSVFNTTPPTVRGRTVYVQFSNHRELKIDQNHSITVSLSFSRIL